MSTREKKKKKKKSKQQLVLLKEEEIISETFPELLRILEELKEEDEYVDIQVCPRCKSARVKKGWYYERGYVRSLGCNSNKIRVPRLWMERKIGHKSIQQTIKFEGNSHNSGGLRPQSKVR
jgi:hypothetical protein